MSSWLGCERVHLPVCGSTNDEAQRLAAAGAVHGTVVTADQQHAGRGRQGRAWHSPPGENLYLSCILRPALAPAAATAITLAAGLGVADAVQRAGAPAALKWPNDVLVHGRKLSGILTEMSTRGERVQHLVVGIGVNLESRSFPPEIGDRATSLALLGVAVERQRFVDRLLSELETWFDRFFAGGVAALADAWLARADRSRVRATSQGRLVEGSIVGLDADGCLLIA
ncbi:MAG TPA: biotin--[acetyl-CoA-carboxylase] ligase, partial [Haliangium sp.]|nr:biotin--[acetyl-CoA-carboxylase] ligase [Haliangium sp.]